MLQCYKLLNSWYQDLLIQLSIDNLLHAIVCVGVHAHVHACSVICILLVLNVLIVHNLKLLVTSTSHPFPLYPTPSPYTFMLAETFNLWMLITYKITLNMFTRFPWYCTRVNTHKNCPSPHYWKSLPPFPLPPPPSAITLGKTLIPDTWFFHFNVSHFI